MSQEDVIAVFGPGEMLTRAEIVARCVDRGANANTTKLNITAARRTLKLALADLDGRRNLYRVVG